jgi:hypothetical protein
MPQKAHMERKMILTSLLAGLLVTPDYAGKFSDPVPVAKRPRSRPLYGITSSRRGSVNRYGTQRLRELGLAWAGDGVKPRETRQMRRHPKN